MLFEYTVRKKKNKKQKKNSEEEGEKTASEAVQRGRYLFPEVRHGLGDHRMISYELSYELRRGEESLERKNRRETVSRVRYSLTREGRAEHRRRKEGRVFGAVTETANPLSLTGT